MKKLLAILSAIILLSFIWIYFSGLEKRYSYENVTGKQNIDLIKNPNFEMQLFSAPNDSVLSVDIVFKNLNQNVIIESANVEAFGNRSLKLIEVSATDAYYNWVEEKNGKAETFSELPEHLKIVHDSIESYFNYNWSFDNNEIKFEKLKIKISISLNVENKKIQLDRIVNMKLTEEEVFKSPIRFH